MEYLKAYERVTVLPRINIDSKLGMFKQAESDNKNDWKKYAKSYNSFLDVIGLNLLLI